MLDDRDDNDTEESYQRHVAYDMKIESWVHRSAPPESEALDRIAVRVHGYFDRLYPPSVARPVLEAPAASAGQHTQRAVRVNRHGERPAAPLTPRVAAGKRARWSDVTWRQQIFWRTFAAAALVALVFGGAWWLPMIPPTSPFYVFHTWMVVVETHIARTDAQRADVQVTQAQTALDQLEHTVQRGNISGATYTAYLNNAVVSLQGADTYVRQVPNGADLYAFNTSVGQVRAGVIATLKDALTHQQRWDDRVRTTKALAALGANVPAIRQVTYQHAGNAAGNGTSHGAYAYGTTKNPGRGNHSHGNGSGTSGSGAAKPIPANMLAVQVHGTGFLPGAKFYVNGNAVGQVTRVTPTEVDVILTPNVSVSLTAGTDIGIGNGDGASVVYTLTSAPPPPSAEQSNLHVLPPTSSATVPPGAPPLPRFS